MIKHTKFEAALFVPYAEDSSNVVMNKLAESLKFTGFQLRIFIVKQKPDSRVDKSEDLRRKRFLHGEALRDVVFPFQLQKGLNQLAENALLCPELLAEKYKEFVSIEHVDDINDPEFIAKRIRQNTNLKIAFSVRNLQIFKENIIDAFLEKGPNSLYNSHPAELPYLRGLEGPFWTRVFGAEYYTTTLHILIREIDAGPIVGFGASRIQDPNQAVMQFTRDIAPDVAKMIYDEIYYKLDDFPRHGFVMQQGPHEYFTLPTQDQIDEAKRQGIFLTDAPEQIEWLAQHYAGNKKDYKILLKALSQAYEKFERDLAVSVRSKPDGGLHLSL